MTLTSAQVTTVYMAVLRRDATTAEQTSGQVSADAAALSTTLVASTEATNSVDPVVRVYQAAFGRLPDSPGLTYWVDQVRSGARTLENVSASFLGEPEAVTRNIGSATSNADFVTNLYQNVLGRVGDAEGISFWNNALANGMSRGLVLNGFANSLEFRTSTSANVDNLLTGLGNATLNLDTLSTNGSGLSNVTSSTTVTTPTTPTNVTYSLSGVGNTITEGANATVTLTASSNLAAATIFHYSVIARTVSGLGTVSAADFTVASGTISIAAGASSATFDLSAVNDNVMEGFEAFSVTVFDSTFTSSLASANGVIADNALSGQALTLTANIDNIVATAGNDMITAPVAIASSTLSSSDSIDGGAGTDTLLVSINNAITTVLSNVSNVETIYGIATGAGALSLWGTSGVTTVGFRGSTAAGTFVGIGSAAIDLVVENSTDGGTFTHTQAALAGGADAVNLTLGALSGGRVTIGSGAGAGVETLNVSTRLGPVVLSDLVSSDVATLNISGDQSITIGNAAADSVLNSATTINGSTATGALALTIGTTSATSVIGGAGNDALTMAFSKGSDSINAGAGNDTITFSAGFFNTDTVDGGAGVDTLRVSTLDQLVRYAAPSTATLSNLEILDYTGVVTDATIDAAAFTTFNASNTAVRTGALVVTGGAGAFTLGLSSVADRFAADVTINDTGTATNDTLTINNNTLATDAFNYRPLIVNGYETVTFNGSAAGTGGPARQNLSSIVLTADTGGSTRLNLVGSNAIYQSYSITVDVIDASGLTGPSAYFTMARFAFGITSVIGSAGNDTLSGSTTGIISSSISGGAGDDTIIMGAGNDTIDGGAGNDFINAGINLGGDTIRGGDGIDTLALSVSPTAITAAFVTGFEILDTGVSVDLAHLTGAGASSTFTRIIFNGPTFISIANAGKDVSTIHLTTQAQHQNIHHSFSRLVDTTSDAITIELAEDRFGIGSGILTLNNEESVTIVRLDSPDVVPDPTGLERFTLISGLTITDATSLTLDASAVSGDFLIIRGLVAPNLATLDTSRSTAEIRLVATSSLVAMSVTTGTSLNTITTGDNSDTFTLGSGNSVIDAGNGNNTITASSGASTLVSGSGNDTITLGSGGGIITAGGGNDTITLGSSNDTIHGGAGTDTLIITASPSVTTAALVSSVEILESAASVDLSQLTGLSSTLTMVRVTGNLADVSFTNAGNNTNTLSVSGASLQTGRTYAFGRMTDTTSDALTVSIDEVGSAAVLGTLTINDEENVTIIRADVAGVTGSGATTVTNLNMSDARSLTLDIDTTTGGAFIVTNALSAPNLVILDTTRSTADITLSAANSAVAMTVTAGSGRNTITTGSGADTITLGSGGGVINSGGGNDTIIGGSGNETITGGLGNDTINLTAGGRDTVVLSGLVGSSVDTITGFTPGTGGDKLAISLAGFGGRLVDGGSTYTLFVDSVSIQEITSNAFTGALAPADNILILSGATFADRAAAEAAIETGGSRVFTLGSVVSNAQDDLIIVWSNGVDSFLGGYNMGQTTSASPTAAGTLTALAQFKGIDVSIAGTLVQTNFEFIA